MHRQAERGRPVSAEVVALLTAIQVWSAGELTPMLVLVAVHALRKFHSIERVFAFGDVALRALDLSMLLRQGVGCGRVLLNSKSGRLESLNVVTGRAFSFVRAANKLAVVLIFVAVEKC